MFKKKKRYFILIPLVLIVIISVYFFSGVPDLSVEKIRSTSQVLTIYDKDNNISAYLDGGQTRKNVSIEAVPKHVINALLAIEDIRFYEHNGIDIKRIFGAMINDISSGSLKEGGSTITQQLIKNSHLSNEKTFIRKIHEAILALQLERQYTKDEILEMYLNYVYFGRGAYGIQAAAQMYFGVDVQELSVSQGAMLVGVLKAPSKLAPHINMEKAIERRNNVLFQMKKYGFISDEQYKEFSSEDIKIVEDISHPDYGYYTDYVLEESAKMLNISVEELLNGGYSVYTSLDSELQENVQQLFSDNENFHDNKVQAATVVIDNFTGEISAIMGGREHNGMRIYNRITARRQPGSVIKPILVYGPAFENKSITASTVINDYRKDFSGYKPTNFKDVYYGNVTVRKALSLSLNVPAVEILERNGIDYSKEFAERAGLVFDESDNNLALALGGMKFGVTPLEMAGAYSMLARSGVYIEPHCVRKILDSNGKLVYENKKINQKVFSEKTTFLLTDILRDVSTHESNGHKLFSRQIATKTGTVGYNDSGHSDAWSASYVNSHTVVVWMGYDKTTAQQFLPYDVTGSSYPSQISAKIFEKIFEKYGYDDFKVPDGIVSLKIDNFSLKNGAGNYLASDIQTDTVNEFFDSENAPQEINSYWQKPTLPKDIKVQLNELRQAEISFNATNDYTQYIIIKRNAVGDKVIGRLNGKENEKLILIDEEYFFGDSYIIQAMHSKISVNKMPYLGEKSKEYVLN